jgi:hypothetical protein
MRKRQPHPEGVSLDTGALLERLAEDIRLFKKLNPDFDVIFEARMRADSDQKK